MGRTRSTTPDAGSWTSRGSTRDSLMFIPLAFALVFASFVALVLLSANAAAHGGAAGSKSSRRDGVLAPPSLPGDVDNTHGHNHPPRQQVRVVNP